MPLLLLAACAPPDPEPGETGGDDSTAPVVDTGSCVTLPEPPAEKATAEPPEPAAVFAGSVTWTMTFDEAAAAAGYIDCTYTRQYAEMVEDRDRGWLCPDCDLMVTGTAVMTSGYDDCFLQVDDADAARVEHLGLGDVDGVPHFFRSGKENVSLSDRGASAGDAAAFAIAWTDESELDDGGLLTLSAEGAFTVTESETVEVTSPTGARTEPYACGWPLGSPGGPVEQWALETGGIFPNARLEDQCGEPVDIWDFRGFYLVIDASSPNCGPCQQMATYAEEFKTRMAEACVPVEMITLLNTSLSGVNMPATVEARQEWVDAFGLASPVLGDMGFGYALFPSYLGSTGGMSLPSIVVVDPDGRVLFGASGYDGDEGVVGFAEIESVILADFEKRAR